MIRKFLSKIKDGKESSWGNRKEAKKEKGSVKDEENIKYREITK